MDDKRSERGVTKLLPLFSLAVGVLMLSKVAIAMSKGKIYFGWVFESVYADRSKYPYLYWYMLVASAVFGTLALGASIYQFIFPTH
jgi:hypothetical protein